jgi:hypothetical protein
VGVRLCLCISFLLFELYCPMPQLFLLASIRNRCLRITLICFSASSRPSEGAIMRRINARLYYALVAN